MSEEEANMEEGENKENEPKGPLKPMGIDVVKKALSKLAKTYDGLSYAYIVLKIPQEQEYDDLPEELANYVHIRDIDMSKNKFPHIRPLRQMNYLVRIDCNTNEIIDIDIFSSKDRLQFLQTINLSINKIPELPEMNLNSLLELNLDQNEIASCAKFNGIGVPNLEVLRMRTNKLKDCHGLSNMPSLKELYLTENQITTMKGLENLPKLRKLNLKKNQINMIDFCPDLPEMQVFNIRENIIATLKELRMIKFPKITSFNCLDNPGANESSQLKLDCLIYMENYHSVIKKLNKEDLEKNDFKDAMEAKAEKLRKDEEERIEQERIKAEKEEEERKEREEQERIRKEQEDELNKLKEEEEKKLREDEELKNELGELKEENLDTQGEKREGEGEGEEEA